MRAVRARTNAVSTTQVQRMTPPHNAMPEILTQMVGLVVALCGLRRAPRAPLLVGVAIFYAASDLALHAGMPIRSTVCAPPLPSILLNAATWPEMAYQLMNPIFSNAPTTLRLNALLGLLLSVVLLAMICTRLPEVEVGGHLSPYAHAPDHIFIWLLYTVLLAAPEEHTLSAGLKARWPRCKQFMQRRVPSTCWRALSMTQTDHTTWSNRSERNMHLSMADDIESTIPLDITGRR